MVKKKHRLLAAALSIVMVLGLAPANAWAADGELPTPQAPEAHSHPICGAACSGHDDTHVPVNWTPFSLADGGELTTGCYYLNVTVSDDVADQPLTGQTSATLDTSGLADGKYLCRVSWADGESVDSEPVDYTARQPAPALGEGYDIDYGAETITVEPGYEVNSKNDGAGEAIVTGDVSDYFGKIIYIRKEATDTQGPSDWTEIQVAARPAAPGAPALGDVTEDSITVADSSAALEYAVVKKGQTPGAGDWQTGNGGSLIFTGLEGDTGYEIYARVPSTDSAPASLPSAPAGATTDAPSQGTVEIGGIVTDANDKPLSDINVTLKQGDKTLKNTTTDKSGNYSFSGVKAGVYNIVADQDGTTKTILVTVADKDLTEQNIKMPANKNVNSIVEVADDVPDIVVGGVDNVAEEKPPASGQTITVTLKVTKEEDSGKQEAVDAVIPDTSADGVLYFDFSLTKTTKETGGTETTDEIPDTGSNVLEIVVPYDFTGKDSVTVYRHHETSASALTAVSSQPESPTDGTFWADRTGGKIHIYATKFSTYAIAYTVQSGGNGGSGGGSSIPTYPPVIEAGEHGDVTVSPKRPERGDKVTITPKPDAGYEVADVIVTDQNGKPVEVEQNGDGTWSFTQPSGKVTIEVTFRATDSIASCPRDNTCPMAKFTDVNMGAWYHDGVHYCLDNGLMVGTGVNTFSPNGTTTRGQIVTILWRLSDSPVGNYPMAYEDVDPNAYYGEAIRWATSEGVAEGYGNGKFGPDDSITREQLAAMLYRYAQKYGYDMSVGEDTNILSYTDFGQISEYAIPALQWACGAGIINGTSESTLSPQGEAVRAQAAAMLMRFVEQQ